MRVFVAALVASFGIAFFAAAALVWDRRRELAEVLPGRRSRGEVAGAPVTPPPWLSPIALVLYALVLGALLIFGSCLGLFWV